MAEAREATFIVGIDLGTTHTVVASAPLAALGDRAVTPEILAIPQLVTAREREARQLLPSCLYAPLPGEVEGDPTWVGGEMARRRGAEIKGRFVASAKSWLCHAGVDRTADILPWGVQDEEGTPPTPRISPTIASAAYLGAVREAWNEEHPDDLLEDQEVLLTIPASFDEVARELTSKAAELAGLRVSLVEEPTAAFYDAMRDERGKDRSNTAWDKILGRTGKDAAEQFVLVVDVGGGTTDLSLMAIGARKKGEAVAIRRVAVGRHILLGGDNMDLALAHVAEARMSLKEPLATGELAQLVLGCRDAKEQIFSGAREAKVTVLGRGGKLVKSQKSITLTKKDVKDVLIAGFFPIVQADAPVPKARTGLVSFGLPYERDPAITRHIVAFLTRHAEEMRGRGPDAILLNGGVFHADSLAEAVAKQVEVSFGEEPAVLPNTDPDLAVARGAVLYGFARRGHGVRVQSGASHGYYVAIESDGPEKRAVCILPRGADEGEYFEAEGRSFELTTGRTVKFPLYASDVQRDNVGALVKLPKDNATEEEEKASAFQKLPPLVLNVPSDKRGEGRLPVTLGGVLTATGQLELFCTRKDAPGGGMGARIRLEFQLREGAQVDRVPMGASLPPASLAPAPSTGARVADSGRMKEAHALIDAVFGKRGDADPKVVKDLPRELERVLGDRATWTMEVARTLADQLLSNTGVRRRSEHHERTWLMLTGYCMRPGFGDPGDAERVRVFYTIFDGRLAFPDEARNWQQFFIAWRRVSGGLSEVQQVHIRDAFDAVIAPKEANLKPPRRIPEGQDELTMMLASLERVPVARRVALGDWLMERTWTDKDARLWTSIGRLGARQPLYASLHHVVPPKAAEAWLTQLLRESWKTLHTAPHAAVQLARVTGDRARDLNADLRLQAEKKLIAIGARPEWIKAVRELAVMDEAEKVAIMGEGLPIGLRLSE